MKKNYRAKNRHSVDESIQIKVTYLTLTEDLQQYTGKKEENILMPPGSRSGDFFDYLEERYSEVFKKYGPGYLGFTLNDSKPQVLALLKNGDHYKFATWNDAEIFQDELVKQLKETGAIEKLPKGELAMPKWMECTWRRVPCGRDECKICSGIKQDRLRHLMKGENPDDMKSVMEDVGNSLGEALMMIKKHTEELGIDLANIGAEELQEPPQPYEFSLYKKVAEWRNDINDIVDEAEISGIPWIYTEAAADLIWYKNTLAAKTYRQLCNRWHLDRAHEYGEFDYRYTKSVLQECLLILKRALAELASPGMPSRSKLAQVLTILENFEPEILGI